jgi:hypothetical protein
MMTRRDILRMAGALPFFSPALAATLDGKRHISGYNPAQTPTVDMLWKWLEELHNFGPIRMTGTPRCRAFEEFLATEFANYFPAQKSLFAKTGRRLTGAPAARNRKAPSDWFRGGLSHVFGR